MSELSDIPATDIAWFAGLLEGEGCFRLTPIRPCNPRHQLRIELKMNDRDVIAKALSVFPSKTGRIYIQERKQEHHGTAYRAIWSGPHAESVMRAVLPYMGERRSAKIRECLDTPNLSHYPKV